MPIYSTPHNAATVMRVATDLNMLPHSMMDAFIDGFNEVMSDVKPDFDKYTEYSIAVAYESGRTYATMSNVHALPKQQVTNRYSIPPWVHNAYAEAVAKKYGQQAT